MQAEILKIDAVAIKKAVKILRSGELVAFPTETVYGLGADALNEKAVAKIFAAKRRPADNPLIVHIADIDMAERLCYFSPLARLAAEKFWPGPITFLLPKKDIVPSLTTAGLSTVAIRMPENESALYLLRESKLPIAAPSANKSQRPSPTTALHVYEDMKGDIPLILDGGECNFGLESTVLSLIDDKPVILRPGAVGQKEIAEALGSCYLSDSLMRKLNEDEIAPSPGMKHRHYAPKAAMELVKGSLTTKYINENYLNKPKPCVLCFLENAKKYEGKKVYILGNDIKEASHNLFALLRQMDEDGVEYIFAEACDESGFGLALMNRMLRASAFNLLDTDNVCEL